MNITTPLSPIGLVKELTNWAELFLVDQAAQAYYSYLIIYVCVGATEADSRGHT